MSNYKYNGNDIYYIIQRTGTSSSPYNGFPTSSQGIYGSGIDYPQDFNYRVNNIDLSNSNTAHFTTYPNIGSYNVNYTIPNSNPVAYFKHISGYCIGGSGGGGGGGGGTSNPDHGGGVGAPGQDAGGYAAVVQYGVITPGVDNIVITVGSGGAGGKAGGKAGTNSNGPAGDGAPGAPGGISFLKIGSVEVLIAYGGGSGNGGKGANQPSDGQSGTTNTSPASQSNYGKDHTTGGFPSSDWPPNYLGGGTGGTGGKGNGPSANSGTSGKNGYAQLWFSYSAT